MTKVKKEEAKSRMKSPMMFHIKDLMKWRTPMKVVEKAPPGLRSPLQQPQHPPQQQQQQQQQQHLIHFKCKRWNEGQTTVSPRGGGVSPTGEGVSPRGGGVSPRGGWVSPGEGGVSAGGGVFPGDGDKTKVKQLWSNQIIWTTPSNIFQMYVPCSSFTTNTKSQMERALTIIFDWNISKVSDKKGKAAQRSVLISNERVNPCIAVDDWEECHLQSWWEVSS